MSLDNSNTTITEIFSDTYVVQDGYMAYYLTCPK